MPVSQRTACKRWPWCMQCSHVADFDLHCCLQYRWGVFKGMYEAIAQNEGGLDQFSQGEHALWTPGT